MRQSPFPPVKASAATCMKNGKIRKALADHGDDGTAARHVLHFLVIGDAATCSKVEMAHDLRPFGFEIDLAKYDNGVIAEEVREVASADFNSLTQSLSDIADARGWHYDGFECAVEVAAKPAPADSGWQRFSLKRMLAKQG